jgi:hypothetical protein
VWVTSGKWETVNIFQSLKGFSVPEMEEEGTRRRERPIEEYLNVVA